MIITYDILNSGSVERLSIASVARIVSPACLRPREGRKDLLYLCMCVKAFDHSLYVRHRPDGIIFVKSSALVPGERVRKIKIYVPSVGRPGGLCVCYNSE